MKQNSNQHQYNPTIFQSIFVFMGLFVALYAFTPLTSFAQSKVQAPLIAQQSAKHTGLKFKVVGVETHGNITPVQEDIHKIIQETVGTQANLADLKSLIMRIRNIYDTAGIKAHISIPLQDIQGGIIPITIRTSHDTPQETAKTEEPSLVMEASPTVPEIPESQTPTEDVTPVAYHAAIELIEEAAPVPKTVIAEKELVAEEPKPSKPVTKPKAPKKEVKPQVKKTPYAERISGLKKIFAAARANKMLIESGKRIFTFKTPPQKKTLKK